MAKILFTDKVKVNNLLTVPEINKLTADNVNEIKNAVNDNFDELDVRVVNLEENQVTGVVTYSLFSELPITGTTFISYKVTNDSVENNGYYHWTGSFYLKDASLNDGVLIASKNLFNIDDADIAIGYYISSGTGNTTANATYNSTGYIPVTGGETYSRSYDHQMAFYNASKVFISGLSSGTGKTFTAPASAYFIRCTVIGHMWNNFQVELGNYATAYEKYGIKIDDDYIKLPNNEIISPTKQYILDNYENTKYFRQLSRRWKPQTEITRTVGGAWINAEEFSRITNPISDLVQIFIKMYDYEFNEIGITSFQAVIGHQATDNGLINGIFIGDSLSYNASHIVKVNSLLPNLAWDGTRASYSSVGLLGEGRGGWALSTYFESLTGSADDSFTPFMHPVDPYKYYGGTAFWHAVTNGSTAYGVNGFAIKAAEVGFSATTGLLTSPSTNDCMYNNTNARYERWDGAAWVEILEATLDFSFNFAKYRSTWNINQPDFVTIMLGTNDFRSKLNEAAIDSIWPVWAARMEEFIASVLLDSPLANISIMIPPTITGISDNSNGDFTILQSAMMWYARKLIIKSFDNRWADQIYIVDAGTSLDPVYGMTISESLPFSDFTGTEYRLTQSNTPHPSTDGYYQLGIPLAAWIQSIR